MKHQFFYGSSREERGKEREDKWKNGENDGRATDLCRMTDGISFSCHSNKGLIEAEEDSIEKSEAEEKE